MYRAETQLAERTREPGVAIGLAWTPAGGDTLFVEARRIPRGRGKVTFTGQLGDVMEESAKAAVTWVRASADSYGIDAALFSVEDLHIHFPSGGIPKDGPSAGVVLAAALISLYTERPVSPHVAMTGEITLSGHVLPVSGLKEKLLAARRSGITDVVLPAANEPDVREDVPPHIHERLTLHYVKTIEAAIRIAIPRRRSTTHSASRRHAASATTCVRSAIAPPGMTHCSASRRKREACPMRVMVTGATTPLGAALIETLLSIGEVTTVLAVGSGDAPDSRAHPGRVSEG